MTLASGLPQQPVGDFINRNCPGRVQWKDLAGQSRTTVRLEDPSSCKLSTTLVRRATCYVGGGTLRRAQYVCMTCNVLSTQYAVAQVAADSSKVGQDDNWNAAHHGSGVKLSKRQLQTVEAIRAAGVIACVRSSRADWALTSARAALDGGICVLEVTMNTPGALEVIQALAREYPTRTIGAGTVVCREEALAAAAHGAAFLMSPAVDEELVRFHVESNTLFIPGAMTPTEILTALRCGASMVKIFPAKSAGGTDFVKAVRTALPYALLLPAGAIMPDMIESYLLAGAAGVVLSGTLFDREATLEVDAANAVKCRAAEAVQRTKHALLLCQ